MFASTMYQKLIQKLEIDKESFWAVSAIAIAATFVVGGYECVRSAANTLFKDEFGVGALPYVSMILPVCLLVCLYFYGKSITLFGTFRTLVITYVLSMVLLIGGYLLIQMNVPYISAVILTFRKIYIVIIVEQFWSFINSVLNKQQGQKLNGYICGVASIGPVLGGYFVGVSAEYFGTAAMLVAAGLSILPAIFLTAYAFRIKGEPQPKSKQEQEQESPMALKQFFGSKLLLALFLLILTTQILSTVLEFNFQNALEINFPDSDEQTSYSGHFFALTNLVAVVLQFVVTPFMLWLLPFGFTFVGIPLIHFAFAICMYLDNSMMLAAGALLLFKSIDYSVFRAAKETLYVPLDFNARYRAKQLIDSFGYRGGEVGASFGVLILPRVFAGMTNVYAFVAMISAGFWLLLLWPIMYRPRKSAQN